MKRISIKKAEDYETGSLKAAVLEAVEELGGAERFIRRGMKVALKPNLLLKKDRGAAATTDPALVAAVGEIVRDRGAEAILIESPGGPFLKSRLKGIYEATGMTQACSGAGIELNYDVSSAEVRNEEGLLLKNLTIVRAFEDVDVIINLPKLKTHGQMVYTGAVKNMFGIVPGILKAELHFRNPAYSGFADSIIDIFIAKKPVLNIMDAVVAMEGHGPSAGEPRKLGCILVSEDAFLLDYIACAIINLDYRDVPVLRQAVRRGLLQPYMDAEEKRDVKGFFCCDFRIPSRDNPKVLDFSDRTPSGSFMGLLKPKPVFDRGKCVLCGDCVRSCPAEALEIKNDRIVVDLDACIRCYCCQELCPERAVRIKRGPVINAALKISGMFGEKRI